MKSRIKRVAGFGLLLTLCGQPFDASAADSFKFKGRSANAFFESRSGCIGTIVNVFASERVLGNPSNAGEVEVAIEDLNWAATSSRGRQNSHSNLSFQGCHISFHVNGAFRLAEAAGAITVGTSNFTPDPSLAGNLFFAKSGDRSHGCWRSSSEGAGFIPGFVASIDAMLDKVS
jgi:hypothetical protein